MRKLELCLCASISDLDGSTIIVMEGLKMLLRKIDRASNRLASDANRSVDTSLFQSRRQVVTAGCMHIYDYFFAVRDATYASSRLLSMDIFDLYCLLVRL